MVTLTKTKDETKKFILFKASLNDIFNSQDKLIDIAKKWTKDITINKNCTNLSYSEWNNQIRKLARDVLDKIINNMCDYFSGRYKFELSHYILDRAITEKPNNKNLYGLLQENIRLKYHPEN